MVGLEDALWRELSTSDEVPEGDDHVVVLGGAVPGAALATGTPAGEAATQGGQVADLLTVVNIRLRSIDHQETTLGMQRKGIPPSTALAG